MNLIYKPAMAQNILKFSYFFALFLLFSCGGQEAKEKDAEEGAAATTSVDTISNSMDKVILFYGNSLTAGYGLDPKEAFPALIQDKLDSLGLNYTVINAGLSGETTSGGRTRLQWILNQQTDIFILELGANDGLRGIPLEETRKNLQEIIDAVRENNPQTEIILAGMQIPPNLGQDYTTEFRDIFPGLASKNNVQLISFLLEGVAGNPELNQQDGIHPTAEGHKILARNVWQELEPILEKENTLN